MDGGGRKGTFEKKRPVGGKLVPPLTHEAHACVDGLAARAVPVVPVSITIDSDIDRELTSRKLEQ